MKFLCAILILFSALSVIAQELDTENLFYCNSYHNISKLFILDDSLSIGTRTTSPTSQFIKDIILINQSGLVIDSLALERSYTYSFLQDVFYKDDDTLLLFFRSHLLEIYVDKAGGTMELVDEKFNESNKLKFQSRKGLYSGVESYEVVWRYKDIEIGYNQNIKAKGKGKVNFKKYFNDYPEYYILKFQQDEKKRIPINNEGEEITNDFYFDLMDWERFPVRPGCFWTYILYAQDTIYFSVVRENKVYAYSTSDDQVVSYQLPEIQYGESQVLYFDHIYHNYYLVKKNLEQHYEVHRVSKSFTSFEWVSIFSEQPFKIVDNKAHFIRNDGSGKKRAKCHYLVPLDDTVTEEEQVKLHEVIIKDSE